MTFSARREGETRRNPFSGNTESIEVAYKKASMIADLVVECEHRMATYRLRPDEGEMYHIPHPWCVDCRAEMKVVKLLENLE